MKWAMRKMKPDMDMGLDEISSALLKKSGTKLTTALMKIVNLIRKGGKQAGPGPQKTGMRR